MELLSKYVEFKNGKKRPDTKGLIPVYGGNGILDYTNVSNMDNGVVIGRVGAYCGSVFLVEDECWVSDNAIKAICYDNIDLSYLYYLLLSLHLNERRIGTSQPLLTQNILNNIEVDVPALHIQKKISSILGSFDEKIQLNNEINKNLADLVQTLYKEQFSDICSADNTGMLSDLCSYSKDKISVSKLNFNTYYSTENMLPNKAGIAEATNLPKTQQTTFCREGDTLISNIRPYFKKILYCDKECGCSSDVLCFTPTHPRYAAYLFNTLYADNFFAFMIAGSKGTKMPRGDKQQIMTYPLIIPSNEELERFNAIAFPALKQIHSNRAETKKLSALRDTLLPKLMSGELDVSDIDL